MIIPLSPSIDPTSIHASVCIVGAGAAGITLACELDGCGFGVLLLDAGGLKADLAHSRLLYAGTAGAPHPDPTEFRRTGFGGTTRIWGGRCVPFDPIDFERRDYVPNSGWPIAYDDIARHYRTRPAILPRRVVRLLRRAARSAAPCRRYPASKATATILPDRIERYSLPTDFGREHRKKLAASRNVTVLLDARCLRLIKADGEDRIEAAEVIDRRMTRHAIRARRFVVATGGIEATRLLFVSDRDGPGLGNRGDRLGRYYACHIENVCARLTTEPGRKVAFAFEKTDDGVYARRKLQFSADAQRRHRLLNSAFRLHFPDYSDASHGSAVMSAIFLGKSALISEYRAILQHGSEAQGESTKAAHLRNVLLGAPQLARFGADLLMKRVLARRKLPYTLVANADGSYPLEFNAEQIPLEDSRITLSNERDAVGVPARATGLARVGRGLRSGGAGFPRPPCGRRTDAARPCPLRRCRPSPARSCIGSGRRASHRKRAHGDVRALGRRRLQLRRVRPVESVRRERGDVPDQQPCEPDVDDRRARDPPRGTAAGGRMSDARCRARSP